MSEFKYVPVEPTQAMVKAARKDQMGIKEFDYPEESKYIDIYKAMIAEFPAESDKEAVRNAENIRALLRGRAIDEEPRVKHSCNMGVGCEEYGVCYAESHGSPERCGRYASDTEMLDWMDKTMCEVRYVGRDFYVAEWRGKDGMDHKTDWCGSAREAIKAAMRAEREGI